MRLPFIVLDQNALSRDAILQAAVDEARAHRLSLMLTDAALIEIVKTAAWEDRLRGAFARLAAVAELVTIARPIPELVRLEAATGQPASAQLEAHEYREPIRELVVQSQTGAGGALEFMRAHVDRTRARVLPQYLDAAANKAQLVRYQDVFRQEFGTEERGKLGDPQYRRTALASSTWTVSLARVIRSLGFQGAEQLAAGPSIIAHTIFATALIAAKWYRNSGLAAAHADKATNDLLDAEYAVTASFCHGFATQDRNACALWEDLVGVAELRAMTTAYASGLS